METLSALLVLCEGWPVDLLHKDQSLGALMFSLICVWTNGWANTRDEGELGRHRAHYDDTVMEDLDHSCPTIAKVLYGVCQKYCRALCIHSKRVINGNVFFMCHNDVIKWKHFPRYWPFVRGIHRSPVNSPHKGQWRGALMFSLICDWINGWVNNREAGD